MSWREVKTALGERPRVYVAKSDGQYVAVYSSEAGAVADIPGLFTDYGGTAIEIWEDTLDVPTGGARFITRVTRG